MIIITENRYQILDEESDFENEFDKNVRINRNSKMPSKKNATQTEHVIPIPSYPKHVPGNSLYLSISSKGKKCAIFSDSICSRINMNELNRYIKNGNAFIKPYSGATPKELHHYISKHLKDEQPDTCVINVGINSLGKDDLFIIADDIIKCVQRCRDFGANKVLVSSITYRPGHENLIKEVNNILNAKKFTNDFIIIYNDNIKATDIWRDDLHLNNRGRDILANNIINAVNRAHGHAHCLISLNITSNLYSSEACNETKTDTMGGNLPAIGMIEESALSPDISALKEIKLKNVNRLVTGQLNFWKT